MKMLIAVALIFGVAKITYGLDCYDCNGFDFNGEENRLSDCFTTTPRTRSRNCTATGREYCLTRFTINDGVAVSVSRSCADAVSPPDHDLNSNDMPTTNKCVTTLSTVGNLSDTTVCYYHCSDRNSCNTNTAAGLIECNSNCTGTNMAGRCDYITGKCVCNVGFEGDDCGTTAITPTTTLRQCLQCNTETDSSCTSSTTSTDCPATQQYCSTATTTVYDRAGVAKKTTTTRGCTEYMSVIDECAFTDIHTDSPVSDVGYKEITCISTCSSNGCNINNANGVIDGNEEVTMYCLQCDSATDVGCIKKNERDRTLCPVGTTHCKATVSYLINGKTDLSAPTFPAFNSVAIVRECATEAVTKQCTEATFAGVVGVKNVTCTETCNTDGCNDGWPARPKCIQCETTQSNIADGHDACLENPGEESMCLFPFYEYCVTMETGIVKDNRRETAKGIRRHIKRACSIENIGDDCSSKTIRNVEVDTCNYTCTTDGCNQGTSDGTVMVQTMIGVMIPAFLGWLMQMYL